MGKERVFRKMFIGLVVAILILGSGLCAWAMIWPGILLKPVVSGIPSPMYITHSGDGSNRLFLCSRAGVTSIFKNGTLLPAPFLDLSAKVNASSGDQGFLCIAFPPDFSSKQYFYVFYTNLSGDDVVSRISVSTNPDVANPASEQVLLTIPHPDSPIHRGGQLAFNPHNGFLYISVGDGGPAGDPKRNAQNPGLLLGKILRIDVESGPGPLNPYKIPVSNPFVESPGYLPEIWALGLRNPWRCSFDRSTGAFIIADVGQGAYEEIDYEAAGSSGGANYGWNFLEGAACYSPPSGCTPPAGYVPPVAWFSHPTIQAIIGGYVYRGTRFPAMQNIYFFADFFGGIWGMQNSPSWETQRLLDTNLLINTFGEDEAGNIYLADFATGNIYQLTYVSRDIGPLYPLLLSD